MIAVCTNNGRPTLQRGRGFFKTGEAAWGRDVYHILAGDDPQPLYQQGAKTICGRDAQDWILIGPIDELTRDCCTRCKRLVTPS